MNPKTNIKTKKERTQNLYELRKKQTDFPSVKIKNSSDAAKVIRQFYSDDIEIFESVFILLLNNSNTTIGFAKISQGGITGTVVDVRIVCHYAINALATGVILAHNHPSGSLIASASDKAITAKLKNALELLEIKLHDHIILTEESYSSLADEGLM